MHADACAIKHLLQELVVQFGELDIVASRVALQGDMARTWQSEDVWLSTVKQRPASTAVERVSMQYTYRAWLAGYARQRDRSS